MVSHIDVNEESKVNYYYLPERKGDILRTYRPEGYYEDGVYVKNLFSMYISYLTKEDIISSDIYFLKDDEVFKYSHIKIYVGDCCIGTKYFKTSEEMYKHIKGYYNQLYMLL